MMRKKDFRTPEFWHPKPETKFQWKFWQPTLLVYTHPQPGMHPGNYFNPAHVTANRWSAKILLELHNFMS
jgi:hypothetical protein